NKHRSSLLLLKRLLKDGAPITGVGIQGHWSLNYLPLKELDQAFSDYAELGLKVNVSELDIGITGTGGGQLNAGNATTHPQTNSPDEKQLTAQAEAYSKLFAIFEKHKSVIGRVTFWGLSDRRSWRANQYPLLFDTSNNAKPALKAIADVKNHSE